MNEDDLVKKLQKTIKDEIRPLKELVEVIKSKVGNLELFQNVTTGQVRSIKDQQSVINEKLDEIKKNLDTNTESVVTIEATIKIYGDMYKLNNDNMKKLEKRSAALEKLAGIQPPPELSLAEVQ